MLKMLLCCLQGLLWVYFLFYQRGPRYFDPPSDSVWGTCFNCGEEGHASFNCTVAKRKKPCFVCGSLIHNVKKCTMVCLVCFSYSFFCLMEQYILQLLTICRRSDRSVSHVYAYFYLLSESVVPGLFYLLGSIVSSLI